MPNYTRQKFRLGSRVRADWRDDPCPSLITSRGWGNCAYVTRGIDAPAITEKGKFSP